MAWASSRVIPSKVPGGAGGGERMQKHSLDHDTDRVVAVVAGAPAGFAEPLPAGRSVACSLEARTLHEGFERSNSTNSEKFPLTPAGGAFVRVCARKGLRVIAPG